jgi:hypothetical protein
MLSPAARPLTRPSVAWPVLLLRAASCSGMAAAGPAAASFAEQPGCDADGSPSHGARWSYFTSPLCVLYGESLIKYTGVRDDDSTRPRLGSPRRVDVAIVGAGASSPLDVISHSDTTVVTIL